MEKDIIINGLKIHYEESGPEAAPPIILMHGWGCNHSTVRSIAAAIESGVHVFNIDLPGHGKSDEPDSVWGIEDYTRCIEQFISLLQLKSPTLIGHSFGGRISVLLASRNNTEKVILVDSAGIKPRRSLRYYLKVYSFKLMKRLTLLTNGKKKGLEKIEKMRAKKGSSDYRNSSPRMRSIMSKVVNEDLKYAMPSIKSPTLLVWGENDTATPLADAKTMNRLIPDSGLVSFPGCGHYSFLDNPIGFKAVVREFLKNEIKRGEASMSNPEPTITK